jgi:ATP synthase protein I
MVGGAALLDDLGEGLLVKERESTGAGENVASSYRKAGPYLDASWQLAGSVLFWVLVGYFVDRWLHTTPWLLVAGAVLGIGLGFYLFFKALSAIGKGTRP